MCKFLPVEVYMASEKPRLLGQAGQHGSVFQSTRPGDLSEIGSIKRYKPGRWHRGRQLCLRLPTRLHRWRHHRRWLLPQ